MFEKVYRSIIVSALAVFCSACTEKVEMDNTSGGQGENLPGATIVFTAAGDGVPLTKTALAGGTGEDRNKVKFCEGDALSVWYDVISESYAESTKFEMSGSVKSDGSADFTGKVENASDRYFVIYPYVEGMTCETTMRGGIIINHFFDNISIPIQQKAVAGSFDPSAAFSAGVSVKQDDTHHIVALKNLVGLLKFSVPEGTKYGKAVLTSDTSIAGDITINCSSDGNFAFNSSPGSNSITLVGDISNGKDYYFTIAAVDDELDGITVELYTDAKDSTPYIVKSTSKTLDITAGKIVNIGEISDPKRPGWKGDGSAKNPYLIESINDLKHLQECFSDQDEADKYCGKYFLQTSDIDCNGEVLGIGSSGGSVKFTGHYDGAKHKISNFILQDYDNKNKQYGVYIGLFRTAYDASFTGMRLSPKSIDITDEGDSDFSMNKNIGTLVGRTESSSDGYCSITDCIVLEGQTLNLVKPALVSYGSLVGTNSGNMKITGCENRSAISFNSSSANVLGNPEIRIGGLVGEFVARNDNRWCEIDRCRNTADISITDSFHAAGYLVISAVGGIIGKCMDPTDYDSTLRITDCVNTGSISVALDTRASVGYAGGIVGELDSDGDSSVGDPYVYNCLNKGAISCTAESVDRYDSPSAGGIIGYGYNPYMSSGLQIALCVNTAVVKSLASDANIGNRASISCGGYLCVGCYWTTSDEIPGYTGMDYAAENYYLDSKDFSATLNSIKKTICTISPKTLLKDKTWWESGSASWKGSDASSLDLDY